MTENRSRRRFIHLGGVTLLAGLAGCGGGGGGDGTDGGDGEATGTVTPVPDQYATATAQAGGQRDPDALSSQSAVQYQSEPLEGQQCSGCQFYITDKNGDGLGACSIVEGVIDPEGYCTSYVAYEPTTTAGGTATGTTEMGGTTT
jgi:hypothetical protein